MLSTNQVPESAVKAGRDALLQDIASSRCVLLCYDSTYAYVRASRDTVREIASRLRTDVHQMAGGSWALRLTV